MALSYRRAHRRALRIAPAMLRAYRADRDDFVSWCRVAGRVALPAAAETVRPISPAWPPPIAAPRSSAAWPAIGAAHRLKELPWAVDARVRYTLRGIARQHGAPGRGADHTRDPVSSSPPAMTG